MGSLLCSPDWLLSPWCVGALVVTTLDVAASFVETLLLLLLLLLLKLSITDCLSFVSLTSSSSSFCGVGVTLASLLLLLLSGLLCASCSVVEASLVVDVGSSGLMLLLVGSLLGSVLAGLSTVFRSTLSRFLRSTLSMFSAFLLSTFSLVSSR
jgi:hypothetical protein